jgi:hypothetical protein
MLIVMNLHGGSINVGLECLKRIGQVGKFVGICNAGDHGGGSRHGTYKTGAFSEKVTTSGIGSFCFKEWNGMGVMMCDVCESDGYHVESFVSERNDDVPVFMVMDDHAEAEPRRKKDKHNFIVVSNNTIN